MNLKQFLNQVDAVLADRTEEELRYLIHSFARNTSEKQRPDFLAKLCDLDSNGRQKNVLQLERQSLEKMKKSIDELKLKLSMINAGELCITGEFNTAYDEWYNDEDEFLFEDPDGILRIIETGCSMVHQCKDMELYKEGYELAELLVFIEITAEGDYSEYCEEYLHMEELQRHELLHYDMKQLALDSMYLAYQTLSRGERAAALFGIFCNVGYDLMLEDLMQSAKKELEKQEEFLDEWICFLGDQVSLLAKRLIKEALLLRCDLGKMLEAARSFSEAHPEIYELLLLQPKVEKGKEEELISIGEEAMQALEGQCWLRRESALITAEGYIRIGKQQEAEACRLEAFRSKPDLTDYLRVICESRDRTRSVHEAREIYMGAYEREKDGSVSELDYYAIAFF